VKPVHAGLETATRYASVCRQAAAGGAWLARDEAIMGTAIHVELWSDERDAGEAAIDAVMAEMHRIDRAMSPFKPESELSRINRDAANEPVRTSDEMVELIARAIEFSALSGGAFDISYASVGHLYDYRLGIKPNEAALAAGRAAVGWRNLIVDHDARTILDGYVEDLRNWTAGILNWHREVDRYRDDWLARRAHGFVPDRVPALPVPIGFRNSTSGLGSSGNFAGASAVF